MKELHPEVREFADALEHLERFLTEHQQDHWADWVRRSRLLAEESDYRSVLLTLRMNGGMGSFTDLVLIDDPTADKELARLRTEIYQMASALKE